ncbi:hypothetical protein PN441_06095 [Spirulina major CS-329]|jgi:hypothetical protein|uniref:hypothetical protein n=1 Tax=Spirulina sp. TaxID=1157 RepID=UPI003F7289B4|nr:hypothetical protein [Spirulina subsalsa CS-330]MDB9502638.1 hypothetical protein [Spirulina major CS-329]
MVSLKGWKLLGQIAIALWQESTPLYFRILHNGFVQSQNRSIEPHLAPMILLASGLKILARRLIIL